MRPTAAERLLFQRALADTRIGGRRIHAVVPLLVRDQGFDPDTQSGGDTSLGLGQTPEAFRVMALFANVRNVDQALKTFGQAPPGAEVGDVYITIGLRDKATLEQVMNHDDAYLVIDGDRFRPSSLSAAGVGQVEEWVVTLHRTSARFTATGL